MIGVAIVLILIYYFLVESVGYAWIFSGVVLYLAIGYTSLKQHAMAVALPLSKGDMEAARKKVGYIVSRDVNSLDEVGVRKATIESVLENGSDAIFAPLFWFLVGGVPAVIIYRLANTLDAMWGYKTDHFLYFGRFAARMDDILNWLPSRIVALSYVMLGDSKQALTCWRKQSKQLSSPNGGVVMTSGAGALNVTLGGDGFYHGKKHHKPIFGCGDEPENKDINRALGLIDKTLLLWVGAVSLSTYVYWLYL